MGEEEIKMDKTELINKLLWLGYTSAEEGKEKRKEAVSMAHNLLDEYLEDKELNQNKDMSTEEIRKLIWDWEIFSCKKEHISINEEVLSEYINQFLKPKENE